MEENNQNNTIQNEKENDNIAELGVCKKQAEEYLNNWKRERADFVNYKKDEGKRMEEFVKFANASLILEVIEILDDLNMAVKQSKGDGLKRVLKKLEDLLAKHGLEKIKTDIQFDPMLHEAIASRIIDDQEESANTMKEIRPGYIMNGKVIRPARVSVEKLSI